MRCNEETIRHRRGDPFWLNVALQVGGDWPGSTPLPGKRDFPGKGGPGLVRVYQP
jgi:hypothetical protein